MRWELPLTNRSGTSISYHPRILELIPISFSILGIPLLIIPKLEFGTCSSLKGIQRWYGLGRKNKDLPFRYQEGENSVYGHSMPSQTRYGMIVKPSSIYYL